MGKNKNTKYWEDRMVNIFLDGERDILDISKDLKTEYNKALKEIENQINIFYGKYQSVSGLDSMTVKKQLSKEELKSFHNTLDEIIDYAKNHKMDKDYRTRMKLLNMKTRVSRLEELKTNIEFEVRKLGISEKEQLTNAMKDIYTDTYYNTIFETQKYVGLSTSFAMPNTKAVEKLLSTPLNLKNYPVALYR